MSDWKSRFAVIGVAASALLAAKALRQLWLFAELGLLAPPVRKFKGEWALVTGGKGSVGKAVQLLLKDEYQRGGRQGTANEQQQCCCCCSAAVLLLPVWTVAPRSVR
jgi:NADPH:quinone reductase-like Zn-dependent oxidoreductase